MQAKVLSAASCTMLLKSSCSIWTHFIWVNECFFQEKGESYHEIGMYYLVDIANSHFNHFEKEFQLKERQRTNYYEWLDIDNLSNITLYPEFIKNEIHNIDNNPKLMITRE